MIALIKAFKRMQQIQKKTIGYAHSQLHNSSFLVYDREALISDGYSILCLKTKCPDGSYYKDGSNNEIELCYIARYWVQNEQDKHIKCVYLKSQQLYEMLYEVKGQPCPIPQSRDCRYAMSITFFANRLVLKNEKLNGENFYNRLYLELFCSLTKGKGNVEVIKRENNITFHNDTVSMVVLPIIKKD